MSNDFGIIGIFPIPVYITERESKLDSTEKEEIEDIVKGEMRKNPENSYSQNSHIFNTKLKKIKEFCEKHIQTYVKEAINPREELDFYITQSWLNVTKPGESHHQHYHPNSIISGVFYIATEETDGIWFYGQPKVSEKIKITEKESNSYNSSQFFVDIKNHVLLLFPSSLAHGVEPNNKTTTDRISISFNTFVRGKVGDEDGLSELILK